MVHEIQDKDLHFLIDPITRAITNQTAAKVKLMQFDHNSERFTFEVPRFVEGHDMTLCTKVEVHYINIAGDKQAQHADVYRVEDMATEGEGDAEKVTFSWLVSAGATQYAGSLSFLIRFSCLTGEKLDYVWNTDTFKGISIGQGMNNGDAVLEDYADVLAAWETQISTHIEVVEALREEVEGLKEITPEVVHETGDSTEAVMSQAAVTAALDDIKENGAGVELAPTLEGDDADKAPSVQAVNEGLAEKLGIVSNDYKFKRVYAINEDGTQTMLAASKGADKDVLVQREDGGQITVPGTPNGVYSATSKMYVDNTIAPIKRDVANVKAAVEGNLYATKEEYVSDLYFGIPQGALPYFYCDDILLEFQSWDGEIYESAYAETLEFFGENGFISTAPISQRYIEIPEGAKQIGFDHLTISDKNGFPVDHIFVFGSMIFQVKSDISQEFHGIETALDSIIEIQNSLIGGDGE